MGKAISKNKISGPRFKEAAKSIGEKACKDSMMNILFMHN